MTRVRGTGKPPSEESIALSRPAQPTSSIRPLAEDGASETSPISGRRTAYAAGLIIADKYQLKRPLGSGGMGEVWVAHHLNLDIDVAIKFIGDVGGQDAGFAERLLEEARNTARLGHPAIVRALDFGHTESRAPFIVLELLAGEDLATRIEQRGPLAPEEAVATLLPIVHGLSAVHDSGVVHRDIKPENVFLAQVELGVQAKLLDFGIARKTDRVQRLTMRDTALGTPDYMSPEQARGESSDARTDQWSVCVVLFESIANRRPFRADNYNALLRTIIDDPPMTLASFGVDEPALWAILERGLSKSPSQRYPTTRELGEALARWLMARGISEDALGTSLRRVWLRETNSLDAIADPPLASDFANIKAMAALERASTQAHLAVTGEPPSEPVSVRIRNDSGAAQQAVKVALEDALRPSEFQSIPDLEALAELHRGGDPEDRLRRDTQWRVVSTLLIIVCVVFGSAFAILVGTGVIVW